MRSSMLVFLGGRLLRRRRWRSLHGFLWSHWEKDKNRRDFEREELWEEENGYRSIYRHELGFHIKFKIWIRVMETLRKSCLMEIGESKMQLNANSYPVRMQIPVGICLCPDRDLRPEHGPDRDLCSWFALPKNAKDASKRPEWDVNDPEQDKMPLGPPKTLKSFN